MEMPATRELFPIIVKTKHYRQRLTMVNMAFNGRQWPIWLTMANMAFNGQQWPTMANMADNGQQWLIWPTMVKYWPYWSLNQIKDV